MTKMADLINGCIPKLNQKYFTHLQPLHRRALDAMLACKSQCGECVVECANCCEQRWVPLSCGHRACPHCQINAGEHWFNRQQNKLLPVPYFMVTFTLPAQLRRLMWQHQDVLYDVLFRAAAEMLKTVARNNHGINIGFTGVLHTHTRRLDYHPHIHFIVPGGGMVVDKNGAHWRTFKGNYFVNELALAKVFRGIFLRYLADLELDTPRDMPLKWVANVKCVGRGEKALRYLSRYLYRGVVSQSNYQTEHHQVRLRYQDSTTKKIGYVQYAQEDFVWKLMQHVLPRGFKRVRDFGYLHPNAKRKLHQVQELLKAKVKANTAKKKEPICGCCKQPVAVILVLPKRIPFLFRAQAIVAGTTPQPSPS
jgi:hypothetical protein